MSKFKYFNKSKRHQIINLNIDIMYVIYLFCYYFSVTYYSIMLLMNKM